MTTTEIVLDTPPTISTAVLDMALMDNDHQSVLRLGRGEQTLQLELRNRTDTPIEIGDDHGTALNLTFRPGALEGLGKVTVSGKGWKGSLAPNRKIFQTLQIRRKALLTIPANDTEIITIKGLNPSAAGGSRATRVELEYENVVLQGHPPVSGRRHIHLALLHPEVPPGLVRGARAFSGPFFGSFDGTSQVLTGGHQNVLTLGLLAMQPIKVPAVEHGEYARMSLDLRAPRSTLQVVGEIADGDSGWSVENNVLSLHLDQDRDIRQRFATVHMEITTTAEPGIYPLVVRYRNFGDFRGELVFLVEVSALGVDSAAGARAPLIAKRPLTVEGALTATSVRSTTAEFKLADQWTLRSQNDMVELGSGGASKTRMRFWDTDKGVTFEAARGRKIVPLCLGGAANVGIGTNDPTHKLDVTGNAKVSKALTVGGNLKLGEQWTIKKQSNMMSFNSHRGHESFFRLWGHDGFAEMEVLRGDTDSAIPLTLGFGTRVGINHRKPQHTLDVNGSIGTSGAIHLAKDWRITVTTGGTQLQFYKGEHLMLVLTDKGQLWNLTGKLGTTGD